MLFKHNTKDEKGKKLEIKLYEARRKIEKKILEANLNDFYIAHLAPNQSSTKACFSPKLYQTFIWI